MIEINEQTYRQCVVNDKRALFHSWYEIYDVVKPSPMVGGHPGGQISYIVGLVEFEDGHVELLEPRMIRFIDGNQIFDNYCWE